MRMHIFRRNDPQRGSYNVVRFGDGTEREATEVDMAAMRAESINAATLAKQPAQGQQPPLDATFGEPSAFRIPAASVVAPVDTSGTNDLTGWETAVFGMLKDKSRFKAVLESKAAVVKTIDGFGGFAYKRGPDTRWQFVHPDKQSMGSLAGVFSEWVLPALGSLGGELAGGAAGFALGGPPGAVLGAVAGSAVGQGGAEAARQTATGEVDPVGIAKEAGLGSLMMPGMALARKAGRAGAEVTEAAALGLGARVMGLKDSPTMTKEMLLRGRARDVAGVLGAMPTPAAASKDLNRALEVLTHPGFRFPEYKQARQILDAAAATTPGTTVDLSPLDSYLRNWLLQKPSVRTKAGQFAKNKAHGLKGGAIPAAGATDSILQKIAADDTIPDNVAHVIEQLRWYSGNSPFAKMPLEKADGLLNILNDMSQAEGLFGKKQKQVTDNFKAIIRDARAKARHIMGQTLGPDWDGLMRKTHDNIDELQFIKEAAGFNERALPARMGRLERYAATLFGENTTEATVAALEHLESFSGVPFMSQLRRSAIGREIGSSTVGGQLRFGVPGVFPRVTATGGLLGAGLFGGGALASGPIGGALATLAGVTAASPRNVLRLTRLMTSPGMAATGKAGAAATSLGARIGATAAARSLVTSEDERRVKRGPLVLE